MVGVVRVGLQALRDAIRAEEPVAATRDRLRALVERGFDLLRHGLR